MKILYRINQIILIATLILYITIYFGLLSQILLGIIQVISALILFSFWKKLDEKARNKLTKYWIITIVYGLLWFLDLMLFNEYYTEEYYAITLMLTPMVIAGYFFSILNSIKNINESQPYNL